MKFKISHPTYNQYIVDVVGENGNVILGGCDLIVRSVDEVDDAIANEQTRLKQVLQMMVNKL